MRTAGAPAGGKKMYWGHMIKKSTGIAMLLAMLSIAAVLPAEAGFFSSRFDDFKELVQAGRTEDAAALYAQELAYFTGLKGDKRQYIDEVLGQRDRLYGDRLNEARGRLAQADAVQGQMLRWKRLKQELPDARAALASAAKLSARGTLTNEAMGALSADVDRIARSLQAEAPQALLDYGLFTEPSFKEQYPVAVQWGEFRTLPAAFEEQLAKASAVRLAAFKKVYGDSLIPAQRLEAKLGEYYAAARVAESGARSYIAKLLIRERLAKEGWTQAGMPGKGVLLAAWPAPASEVSSYRVAPPTTIGYQSLDARQTPDAFIASGGARNYELVVFVQPARIQMERAESNQRQVASQYQSGTRRVANPAYALAQRELASAQSDLADIRRAAANASTDSSSTLGILSAVVGAASEAAAESKLRSAQSRLASTPQLIEEPVLSAYSYAAKTVTVKQWVPSRYAIYDAGTGKVVTGTINRSFAKTFNVADALRPDDPNRALILKSAQTSADVDAWVKGEISEKYDDIWAAILADYKKKSLGI
ncbi:hypothetical protein [Solimonas variicoloris]|uniref:hypothetical protein n=1 Tax=Solimonas variicoloris TaxID=254408 RepID=UPI000373200F|nr:hypothetical protein [Solimonas variicoloris]